MRWLRAWLEKRDAELDRELEAHLDLEAEEREEAGLAPEEARRAARRAFGNATAIREDTRVAWGWAWLEQLAQDLGFALRLLRRSPGFTAVAACCLALGIGANTAVFSVINAVLLREPPYSEPSRLVRIWQGLPKIGEARLGMSPPEYLDYRDRNRTFSSMAAFARTQLDLTAEGTAERVEAAQVTGRLFETLGVGPLLGRVFTADEEQLGGPGAAILSYDCWHRRYGGDAGILGRTLRLNERPYTVVGVMPPGFAFPSTAASIEDPPALWVPLAFTVKQIADRAADSSTSVIARLGPGASLEQARADVARVADEFQQEYPQIYTGNVQVQTSVEHLAEEAARHTRPMLFPLAGAVGFVLLIACGNVANLLLGRAAARQGEMALRRALGASRERLIRQLLVESLLLTGQGGALGVGLAYGAIRLAAKLGPDQMPGLRGAEIDSSALAFTLALSLGTGVLCGLAPVFGWSPTGDGERLKESGRKAGGLSRRGQRTRAALVVLEAASALVLLACAGLLIRSFAEALRQPPGFDPEGVLVARTSFNRVRYPDANRRREAERAIIEKLEALPGVENVAVTTHLPLADERTIGFTLESGDPHEFHWASNALVSGEYFAAMGIPLVRGRTFTVADAPDAPTAAVINETMARSYWPAEDAVGKRIVWGGRLLSIVGIAGDVRLQGLDAAVAPTVYCSVYQVESGATAHAVFSVRAALNDPAAMAPAVREAIVAVDRGLPVFGIRTMQDVVARSLVQRRFVMLLAAGFAGLALALAVIGLYAVLAHAVAERTPELGVRLALGASPSRLVAEVLGQGMRLGAAGTLLGAILAIGATTAMSKLVFGISALDPVAFGAAGAVLLAVAFAASYLPARRAARVDPLAALRRE